MKRINKAISILLSIALVLALLPAAVSAAPAAQVITDSDALLNAINNASEDPDNPTVIKLGRNITYDTNIISIAASKYVEIDLNGQGLTVAGISLYSGNLTVKGSGSLTSVRSDSKTISIRNGGAFTLSGGIISRTNAGDLISVQNQGSKFTMTGGELVGNNIHRFLQVKELLWK